MITYNRNRYTKYIVTLGYRTVLDFRVQQEKKIVFMKRTIKTVFERERKTFQMVYGVEDMAVEQIIVKKID